MTTTSDQARTALLAAQTAAQAALDAITATIAAVTNAITALDDYLNTPGGPGGRSAPTVLLSAPGAVSGPGALNLAATPTTDPSLTVASVAFLVDGAVVVTDTTAPYAGSVTLTAGSHTLQARVTDSLGQSAVSQVITLVVPPPVVPPPTPTPIQGPASVDQEKLTFTGTWTAGVYAGAYLGEDRYTAAQGGKARLDFIGTKVDIYGTKDVHHGTATVTVDGGANPTTLNFKGTVRQEQVLIGTVAAAAGGTHYLEITAVGDGTVSIDRLEIDPTTPPPPPPPPPGNPGSVRVTAGHLVDAITGKKVVLIGPNQYMDSYVSPGDMDPVSNWVINNRDKLAGEWAGYGCNFVRVPVKSDRTAGYVARLKLFTDAMAAKGIRTLLCPFGGVTWAPSASNGQLAADLWVALGKPVHVLLETVNEPNPQAYADTPAAWLSGNQAEVAAIRAKGYTQPILVGTRSWCWTIPVAEAKTLANADSQLVFMSHRYAFDGSTNRQPADAQAWVAEWKAAAQQGLCIGVGEYGWYNGGGTSASIAGWCKAMADAQVQAVKDGWLSVALAWMYLWDENSHISGATTGGGYWPISQGEAWTLNQWGLVAKAGWLGMAAAAATLS